MAQRLLSGAQFEPVRSLPGLYRLTHPGHDGRHRARQAVHALRVHGFRVQADYSLDPAITRTLASSPIRNGVLAQHQGLAQSLAPQRAPSLSAPASAAVSGTGGLPGPGRGR
ncbi:hypothetical protein AB0I84_29300 [Streptomyces spectabilis]|uniref:hypothetical protein n=1 Tax=Streptomyces spectabilis TaxID=68270 RepID=UPI00340BDADC